MAKALSSRSFSLLKPSRRGSTDTSLQPARPSVVAKRNADTRFMTPILDRPWRGGDSRYLCQDDCRNCPRLHGRSRGDQELLNEGEDMQDDSHPSGGFTGRRWAIQAANGRIGTFAPANIAPH